MILNLLKTVLGYLICGNLLCWCCCRRASVRVWKTWALWQSFLIPASTCPSVIWPVVVVGTSNDRDVRRHGFLTILAWRKCLMFSPVLPLLPIIILQIESQWVIMLFIFSRGFCSRRSYSVLDYPSAGTSGPFFPTPVWGTGLGTAVWSSWHWIFRRIWVLCGRWRELEALELEWQSGFGHRPSILLD